MTAVSPVSTSAEGPVSTSADTTATTPKQRTRVPRRTDSGELQISPWATVRPSRAVSRNGKSRRPEVFCVRPDRFDYKVEFVGAIDLARYAVGHAGPDELGFSEVIEGRKLMIRSMRRTAGSWEVLIKDHHERCIRREEFVRNQEIIFDNANGKSYLGRGSVRRGEALLPGLFRCGRCGRKLQAHYGSRGTHTQRYACRGAFNAGAEMSCISFGGVRVDRAVAQEVLERVQPLGIEAAIAAMKSLEREC